jgi:iron complex outermembrane receptor protein
MSSVFDRLDLIAAPSDVAAPADMRGPGATRLKMQIAIALGAVQMFAMGGVARAQQVAPRLAQASTAGQPDASQGSPKNTKSVVAAADAASGTAAAAPAAKDKAAGDADTLDEINVSASAIKDKINPISESSMGFAKDLLDTPRTVSFVDADQLALKGITSVEDLTKAVPGVYTTTRYGYAGGINIRDVQADNYYRGMKRITAQGHSRTDLDGAEAIEIVKGPPSPIYGVGAIGGYMNFTPRTGRSTATGYLTQGEAYIQGNVGSYNKTEVSFGAGGPYEVAGKQAGYYIFGVLEKSNTFIEQVGVTQRLLQAGTSVDNILGPLRLETGFQAQNSITTGAFMNRVTQDLVDHGTYLTGSPMAVLDPTARYAISTLDLNTYSPVKGTLSAGNQPLTQRFNWPVNPTTGKALAWGQFPVIPGIPQSMHDYLNFGPGQSLNCYAANVMRTMPVGGPLPAGSASAGLATGKGKPNGYLPVGLVLDPCTVGTTKVDYHRNGAWEREQNAQLGTGFADLIWDVEPGTSVKNQLFYDLLDSYKDSYLPYGESQDIHLFEDKITAIHRIPESSLPQWLAVNALSSINYRRTSGSIVDGGGDWDWRQDVMAGQGLQQPNNMFYNPRDNNTYANGAPATTNNSSYYDERGLGVMFDMDFFKDTNLVVGYRYDILHSNALSAPPYNATTGVSVMTPTPGFWPTLQQQQSAEAACAASGPSPTCPGALLSPGQVSAVYAHGDTTSSGGSWSASLSQRLPWGMRPYITISRASLELSGSNDILTAAQVATGHLLGHAQLKEVGIKGSWLDERLFITIDGYEQQRQDALAPSDPGASANVTDTYTRGTEIEIKYNPFPGLYLTAYALAQHGIYLIGAPSGTTFAVNGRDIGFQNVMDPNNTGKVLYYANDFLYGGSTSVNVPVGDTRFADRTGDPTRQFAWSANYKFTNGLGLYAGQQLMNGMWADRMKSVYLPAAKPIDVGITYETPTEWRYRLNGSNVTSVRYWRPNIGDTSAKTISAMPTVQWELSVRKGFHY